MPASNKYHHCEALLEKHVAFIALSTTRAGAGATGLAIYSELAGIRPIPKWRNCLERIVVELDYFRLKFVIFHSTLPKSSNEFGI
jgi:hypothetical protein